MSESMAAAFSARLCRGLLVLGGARVAVSRRSQKISNSITGVVGSPKLVRVIITTDKGKMAGFEGRRIRESVAGY
jgi:hypothetical protein